jgi:DNA ligase-1
MNFNDFCALCDDLEKTSSSLEKIEKLSLYLSQTPLEQISPTIRLLSGKPVYPPELKSGIGNTTIRQALASTLSIPLDDINSSLKETGDLGISAMTLVKKNTQKQVSLMAFTDDSTSNSVIDIHDKFNEIASLTGSLSSTKKSSMLSSLFSSLSPIESKYLCRLALEDLRIGVAEGILINAIAKTADIKSSIIERAFNLTNDLGNIAFIALSENKEKLNNLDPQINRYVRVMLGQISKDSIEDIIEPMDSLACEWKYDGARLQIHKDGDKVTLYSKKPENVTNSFPDVVENVLKYIKAEQAIVEGEVVAIDTDGSPLPFSMLLQRIRRKNNIESYIDKIPVCVYLFDVLKSNDASTIDLPLNVRRQQLESIVSQSDYIALSSQLITHDPNEIDSMYNDALRAGHEGIMIKKLSSPYVPGKRGKDWIKKKPLMENMDLVVTGGEWGQGRRTKFFGSYTLSCRNPETNEYLEVGKIGTGINDTLLSTLTEQLTDCIESENGTNLSFSPKVVLEVSYEEIQGSPTYNSGYSLRFPRLVRIRSEKGPKDIATISQVEALFKSQKLPTQNN